MEPDDTGWTTIVVVAAVVGMLTVLLLWLFGRSGQRMVVRRTIETEASVVFSFLSDPHSLSVIHPYTTEIGVEDEMEEEGGRRRIQFVWVEKVPITAKSLVTLTSDPSTGTVVLDITPAGSMFQVQLTWRCKDMSIGAADDISGSEVTWQNDTEPPPHHTSTHSAQASRDTDSTQDSQDTTAAAEKNDDACTSKDDNHISKGDNHSSSSQCDQTTSGEGRPSTLFENHVVVTGPRVIAVVVARFILPPVQNKMADNLQQHFAPQKG